MVRVEAFVDAGEGGGHGATGTVSAMAGVAEVGGEDFGALGD